VHKIIERSGIEELDFEFGGVYSQFELCYDDGDDIRFFACGCKRGDVAWEV
jgi:hypothetical protein